MKKPNEIHAVVCEDGNVFVDEDDLTYAANSYEAAEQFLEMIAQAGSRTCECDRHRIVTYVAQVKP